MLDSKSDLVRGRGHEFPVGTARPPLCRVVQPSGHLVNVSPPKAKCQIIYIIT